jgi:hypothetical protein
VEGERQAGFVLTVDVTGLRLNSSRPVVTMRNRHKKTLKKSVLTVLALALFKKNIHKNIFIFVQLSNSVLDLD